MDLRSKISKILDTFLIEKETPFKKNDLASTIKDGLSDVLSDDFLTDNFETHGSAGMGQWAIIPWIGIFDKEINISPQKGFDIVYLFSAKSNYVYLSLNQGWTFYKKTYSRMAKKNIRQVADLLLSKIFIPSPRMTTSAINLTEGQKIISTSLPRGYELSNILSIKYDKSNLPSNDKMLADLHDMITVLEQIKDLLILPDFKDNIEYFLSEKSDQTNDSFEINEPSLSENDKFFGRKLNYSEINNKNKEIEDKGEKLVLEFEREKLKNHPNLLNKISHVSDEIGDGLGYDIKSYTPSGKALYIEVKTTTDDVKSSFFVSLNELKASKYHKNNYVIFRIYDLNENTNINNLKYYLIKGNLESSDLIQLEPSAFKAKLK